MRALAEADDAAVLVPEALGDRVTDTDAVALLDTLALRVGVGERVGSALADEELERD